MDNHYFSQESADYRRVEQAIHYLEDQFRSSPDLEKIAAHVGLSKFHFDRLFRRWAGISPMRFLRFLTLEYTKEQLARSANLLDTAYDAGLSGPGRLHDLYVTFEAMTPGEYKQQGKELSVAYGLHHTPFGLALIGITARGICHLSFVHPDDQNGLSVLRQRWPQASFTRNQVRTGQMVQQIFAPAKQRRESILLHIKGTNFQFNVWRALCSIPPGRLVSYRDVAVGIGRIGAHRAVANAVARNPVGFLIPCHRVIARSGKIHAYRWGVDRKKAILGYEAAHAALK